MKQLFTPFFQASDLALHKHDGTGLGLVITKRFCEILGGSIDVRSVSGQGSTFTIRLPRSIASDQSELDEKTATA